MPVLAEQRSRARRALGRTAAGSTLGPRLVTAAMRSAAICHGCTIFIVVSCIVSLSSHVTRSHVRPPVGPPPPPLRQTAIRKS